MADQSPFATCTQAIGHWARVTPRAIAVVEGDAIYSYTALALNIAQTTEMLRSHGLRRGMIAGIQCQSRYSQLLLILACELIGATHWAMQQANVMFETEMLDRCDLLCVETVTEAVERHSRVVLLSQNILGELAQIKVSDDAALTPAASLASDDLCRIATTSGTTGQRKAIGHTRGALRRMIESVQYTLNADPESYNFVSVYRVTQWSTYSGTMLALWHGKMVNYCTDQDFLPTIRRHLPCHTTLLVVDALAFAKEAAQVPERADTCCLRVTGGSLSPTLRDALRSNLTSNVITAYASNEASYISLIDNDGVGTLWPDVAVEIVNEAGQNVAPGEPGIIRVRSPRVTASYLWDEDLTAKYFIDGWFQTSDLGRVPAPGKLILLGRVDDMLNVGGLKVAPYPIEERIRSIDGVTDAVIVNHSTPNDLDELHMFVECRERADFAPTAQLVDRIIGQHKPRITAHYGTQLPRTDLGKVRRETLREHLARDFT